MSGMFGRRNKEGAEGAAEAPKPIEASGRRERPDFNALAQQRVDAFKQSKQSKWDKLKAGFNKARDFVLTIDARTAYRAGQAKDAGVEGAQFVAAKTVEAGKAVGRTAVAGAEATVAGAKFVGGKAVEVGQDIALGAEVVRGKAVETGKAVGRAAVAGTEAVDRGITAAGRGVKATAEFGAGMAVMGVEAGVAGGRYVIEKGQQGAEAAWEGIRAGVETAKNKYAETRTSIADRFRAAREAILNRVEMIQLRAAQKELDDYKAKVELNEIKAGLTQARIDAINEKARGRLGAKGISPEQSESQLAA